MRAFRYTDIKNKDFRVVFLVSCLHYAEQYPLCRWHRVHRKFELSTWKVSFGAVRLEHSTESN
jgi:hypothetical protein